MKFFRSSVRWKMILMSLFAIFATVGMCLLLNRFFLVKYYENSKLKTLGTVYGQINRKYLEYRNAHGTSDTDQPPKQSENEAAITPETDSELNELHTALDVLCSNNGISVAIAGGILPGEQKIENFYFFGNGGKNEKEDDSIREMIADYLLPGISPSFSQKKQILERENYRIYSLYDKKMKSKYIELIGTIDTGEIILMRSNVESMQESVHVFNRFLVYVGIAGGILIFILMLFLTKKFVKPLLVLTEVSGKMADLDFNAKCEPKGSDEVAELGRSMNALSGKLEQTISELKSANVKLMRDIEEKQHIDDMRKEFLSNVTHELKTPLALISGYAEGLKDNINESDEERDFYCDVIMDEASKMNLMVQKLLTLNRLEFGNIAPEMEHFNLTELVTSVVNSVSLPAQQAGAVILFECREAYYVWADTYLTEEVVTNYLSNALNHVKEMPPRNQKIIEIKIIPQGNRVRVAVFNTGERIPEEDIPKLWDKFYKVDKARTREYGGHGIGLSIVKAIMELHRQRYGVINHSSGVEFWFEADASNMSETSEQSQK